MAADYTPGGFVPYDRLDITELLERPLELFVFGVARFEVFTGVIVCRNEFFNREFLYIDRNSSFSADWKALYALRQDFPQEPAHAASFADAP